MTSEIKIEVDNKKTYLLLRKIYDYYVDFSNNEMISYEDRLKLQEIIDELFSEERTGFKRYIEEFFEDNRKIDIDSLKEAYDTFCLEKTIVDENKIKPHWIM